MDPGWGVGVADERRQEQQATRVEVTEWRVAYGAERERPKTQKPSANRRNLTEIWDRAKV
jgi:hypothetical protein